MHTPITKPFTCDAFPAVFHQRFPPVRSGRYFRLAADTQPRMSKGLASGYQWAQFLVHFHSVRNAKTL